MTQRIISKVTQGSWHEGFLGIGHSASAVFDGIPYEESDPFILFMDDKLNLPGGEPVGGAHPHAGFETLTLVLEGNEKDWKTGSFELMTAGKGIIHTEEITSKQNLHILQVWLALPPEKRWAQPFWQKILLEDVPSLKNDNYQILVYSGSSNGLTSPVRNHTPLTLVDFRMKAGQAVVQELPASQNGLIYVLDGSVQVGDKTIKAGQAGWLNRSAETGNSELALQSLEDTHFVLYAAQPHNVPIVAHGPFIGDTKDDIVRLYKAYGNGQMPHLNNLPGTQKISFGKAQQ
ncbi:pirin-like C-terminal cupin domain-containing protein [Danxiaibacter flavus]|uniref:Pirin-like C-terminal cupin domain-containing protein n=1 Tax=Danxiaibacter flavus TaxID=3049108 RepID=A0ABV3ZM99_9BACT|nr:pirin-like C-terminal cupin domain-containing protein [Chitinophagaceae bacterium DXS]